MTKSLKIAEISAILKKQLSEFELKSDMYEVGRVISVGDGIARVYGLTNVMAGELLDLPGGLKGMALNLETDNVGVAIFGEDKNIREGDEVKRTQKVASVPVGENLVGRVVNALGEAIDGGAPIQTKDFRQI